MWRKFFGNKARIIGIDINPIAKKWEKNGFEIFIGNQSDPNFWKNKQEAEKTLKDKKSFEDLVQLYKSNFNKIDEIVSKEIKKSDYQLDPFDFAVGVTGGTNIMASGATIGAMLTGTKAYYVHDDRMPPKRKRYTEFLPIPPINIIRSLKDSHLKLLQTLEKGSFELRGEKQIGVMTNQKLQEKLKVTTSTLNSALKTLKEKGYVETKRGVPVIRHKRTSLDEKPVEFVEELQNQMLVKITELGKIQAKKASMRA